MVFRLEDIVKARAKENQRTSTGGSNPQLILNSEKAGNKPINTDKELAQIAGVSADSIWKPRVNKTKVARM